MNTKKSKHKKPNKPPNPNPPQKLENITKIEEVVHENQQLCEVNDEQIISQVISEVVEAPVCKKLENQEVEGDTPKKPNRNKGKKKKEGQDNDFIEKVEVIREVPMETNVHEPVKKIITEEKGDVENKDPLDESAVVPSARKKKNKKKNQEKLEDPGITQEIRNPNIESELAPKVVTTIEVTEKVDPNIKELFSLKPETVKQDKKKKNKKKKRNDSDRSDKSEDIMSCTSAFQKLLVEDENSKEQADEIASKPTSEFPVEEEIKKIASFPEISSEEYIKEASAIEATTEIKEQPKDEVKGKKKNKKDKKHPPPELVKERKLAILQDTSITVDDIVLEKVSSNELKQVLIEPMEKVLEFLEKEPSPKVKAKIAKPVDKKRKGKQDLVTESLENISGDGSEIKLKEKKEVEVDPEIKLQEVPTFNVIESQIPEQISQQSTNVLEEAEKICIPSDNKMGKKRKKSPKPPETYEPDNIKKEMINLSKIIQCEVDTAVKDSIETVTSILMQSEIVPEIKKVVKQATSDLEKVETQMEIRTDELPIKPSESTPEKKEEYLRKTNTNIPELLPFVPETKIDEEGFEIKTSKKKKKTLKVPVQLDVSLEGKEPELVKKKIEDIQEKHDTSVEKKLDVPLDLSFSSELEVRSVKTDESESSTCDNTPDIFFIRSSSQQLFDNNNNTVIQEVMSVDESKLSGPIAIPLIEGSGETPIRKPELVTPDIRMSEYGAKSPTDEKTDLKSKMLEVNQDMEDLRLSIERSLAEFTAMDKCGEEMKKERDHKSPLKVSEASFKDEKSKLNAAKLNITLLEVKTDIPVELHNMREHEKPKTNVPVETLPSVEALPVCPARKDNKGKGKSKKKGRQEVAQTTTTTSSDLTSTKSKDDVKEEKQKSEKTEQKSESTQEKGKQQSTVATDIEITDTSTPKNNNDADPITSELSSNATESSDFEPIENFEDALTSSIDDVNKTFEMIAKDSDHDNEEFQKKLAANKPEINVTQPTEDTDTKRNEKAHPVSQPKNLLGHYDIPVQSNKTDYKKEKNKTPNARQAKVKIKDSMDVENKKQSKESQTDTKRTRNNSDKTIKESFSKVKNDNEEYVYKYSFRKVFLQSACQICNKDLSQVRVPCGYCSLVFYCGARHKDEDWPQHQALCFAVSTLAHMKDQKHVYADAQMATGQDYRLLRMQMIVSSEKVLKRRLVPWEQEAMLYPRICADVACREWRQGKLRDCEGCGQLSYCTDNPEHLPKTHQRWCKSYSLYQKLVTYQQTKGRLEPKLPTKVMTGQYEIPGKINEVLAALYEEKIDMNDIQYAALTQLATAPLTTAYCLQMCRNKAASKNTNGVYKKQPFTIHVVGAELQFEADALNKWEVFFLHLRPDVQELKVVLVSPMLNPGNLPLDLLAKIKLCDDCRQNKRRVVFAFEDNKNYFEYRNSENFINPDITCAFNPSIQRSSVYNGKDPWPASINSILKLKQPFVITSYTLNELRKDIARIKECSEIDFKLISEPGFNSFASVRPDRNFISDDEIPLLFKNYCVGVLLGC